MLAGVTAGLLTGCGEDEAASPSPSSTPSRAAAPSNTPPPAPDLSGLSAQVLAQKSRAALDATRTFHVDMTVADKGEAFTTDIDYGTLGSHGSMTVDGDKLDVLTYNTSFYLRAPDKFWRKQLGAKADEALAILSGKWLKLARTDKQFAEYSEFGTRDGFVRGMLGESWLTKPRKTGQKTINGVACIGLADDEQVLWINKVDARPVRFESAPGSSATGRMTFSEYNAVSEPKPPPTATVIDVTKLRR